MLSFNLPFYLCTFCSGFPGGIYPGATMSIITYHISIQSVVRMLWNVRTVTAEELKVNVDLSSMFPMARKTMVH